MFNFYELEELARLAEADAAAMGAKARLLMALEEAEEERLPLRRRLATALIQLGVRIDPLAAEALASASAA